MRETKVIFTAFFALMLPLVEAFAQIKATQLEPEYEYFESPMLLEFPIQLDREERWRPGPRISPDAKLSRYVCDGVSITYFNAEAAKPKNGLVKFKYWVGMTNRPGHDKLVSVRFEVFRGDEAIAPAAWLQKVDVEEGKPQRAPKFAEMYIPVEKLQAEGPPVMMKLRLEAIDH